jgi:hypothetical protein
LLSVPTSALAAIAFDSGGTSYQDFTASPQTFTSHTAGGTNRILFFGVSATAATTFTSVTYDGVAMTLLTTKQTGSFYAVSVFYLINPNTTPNANLVVTFTGRIIYQGIVSYTGVSQSANAVQNVSGHVVKGASSATSETATVDSSQTTSQDKSWQMGYIQNEAGTVSAGTGTTIRGQSADNAVAFSDNNAAITPAGTNSLNWTTPSAWNSYISWTVAPAAAAAAPAPDDGFVSFN